MSGGAPWRLPGLIYHFRRLGAIGMLAMLEVAKIPLRWGIPPGMGQLALAIPLGATWSLAAPRHNDTRFCAVPWGQRVFQFRCRSWRPSTNLSTLANLATFLNQIAKGGCRKPLCDIPRGGQAIARSTHEATHNLPIERRNDVDQFPPSRCVDLVNDRMQCRSFRPPFVIPIRKMVMRHFAVFSFHPAITDVFHDYILS